MFDSDLLCKVLFIGSECVGKSSILSRFVSNQFSEFYRETVGVDFQTRNIIVQDKRLKCQFWDASGSEKYRSVISAYFKGATAIIGVYDVTNRESFDSLKQQLECYSSHISPQTSILILGNKTDLNDKRQVAREELEAFTNGNNFLGGEVSAKYNTDLTENIISLLKQTLSSKNEILKLVPAQECGLKTFTLPKISNSCSMPTEREKIMTQEQEITQALVSRSEFLNANSNSFLLGSASLYNKDQNKKIIADLVEQVSLLKNDNEKKDELIKELNTIDESDKYKTIESSKVEYLFGSDQNLQNELQSKKTQCESLISQLNEATEKTAIQEIALTELKSQVDAMKCEKNTYDLLITEQRNHITSLEADLASYEIVAGKSELTINTLQANNAEMNLKLLNLEADINTCNEMRETIINLKASKNTLNKELQDLKTKISQSIGIDVNNSPDLAVSIKEKFEAMTTEAQTIKTTQQQISEQCISAESENKVTNEMIERLVIDLNKSETSLLALKQEHETMKVKLTSERDSALNSKNSIQEQFESFKVKNSEFQHKLDTNFQELETTKVKASNKEKEMTDLNNGMVERIAQNEIRFKEFKEEISKLLSDYETVVDPDESKIKECIQCLMTSSLDRGVVIATLTEQVDQLTSQLKHEQKVNTETKSQTNCKITELDSSVRTLQNNLCATVAARDQLNSERAVFSDFYENLATSLKFSISFDTFNKNSILQRVKELLAIEEDVSRVQKKLDSAATESKLKAMEEELSNKEVHMNLLRNRIVDLEEGQVGKVYGKSELKSEYTNLLLQTKKQKVKIEKISGEYNALKAENTLLKAEAMDNINLSEKNYTKDTQMTDMNQKINTLTSLNDKHLVRINELRDQNDSLTYDLKQALGSSDEVIQKLSTELRCTKQDLIKSESREKQLLEFRDLVSKKLGLNISGFTLGEYEYVANIENVLNSSQNTGIIHLQQATSQSLLGNSTIPTTSARACVNCPSWSSCVICMSVCSCSCQCKNNRNGHC